MVISIDLGYDGKVERKVFDGGLISTADGERCGARPILGRYNSQTEGGDFPSCMSSTKIRITPRQESFNHHNLTPQID